MNVKSKVPRSGTATTGMATIELILDELKSSGLVLDCAALRPDRACEAAAEATFCPECNISSAHPNVSFDERGTCNLCRSYRENKEKIAAYFKTLSDLESIFDKNRLAKPSEYDCLLLYSGGKDSTYALYKLMAMGVNVMTFTFDNGFISQKALENIAKITTALNVTHVTAGLENMPEVFRESLEKHSSVCNGCFKGLLELSLRLAEEKKINYIVTGLSRGQIISERLAWFYERNIFDCEQIESELAVGRKVYHGLGDYKGLRLRGVEHDSIFDRIALIDFYRYTDVAKSEILRFLKQRDALWEQPSDCGFCSSNCLINDVGIFVHKQERGYHNYEAPTAWEVRMGHLSLDAAREELREVARPDRVRRVLKIIGYEPESGRESRGRQPVVYCVPKHGVTGADLLDHLRTALPKSVSLPELIAVAEIRRDVAGDINREALRNARAFRKDSAHGGEDGDSGPTEITLSIGQRQWLEAAGDFYDKMCQTIAFETPGPVDVGQLKRAILQVMLHHDGLRLRFAHDGVGWSHAYAAAGGVPFSVVSLAGYPKAKEAAVIEAAKARIRAGLNLSKGPVARFTYFSRGEGNPGTLLICIHEAVIDRRSWQVLISDLETAYRQQAAGEAVELPRKTTSLRRWGEWLESQGVREDVQARLSQLRREILAPPDQLPVILPAGRNDAGGSGKKTVSVLLDKAGTGSLLRLRGPTGRGRAEAILLTALMKSITARAGRRSLLWDLMDAGRASLADDLDLSRTIGRLKISYPTLLELGPSPDPPEELASIERQLYQIPNRGIVYGMLRYFSNDYGAKLSPEPPGPRLRFSYPGCNEEWLPKDSIFKAVAFDERDSLSGRYMLDIAAEVFNGRLRFQWSFSETGGCQSVVESLADETIEILRRLLSALG
ncbi:MAG: condensation domain-containing protein [Blastocatellia bacterium]